MTKETKNHEKNEKEGADRQLLVFPFVFITFALLKYFLFLNGFYLLEIQNSRRMFVYITHNAFAQGKCNIMRITFVLIHFLTK